VAQENVEIVRKALDAFNRRDWDAAAELGTPETELHFHAAGHLPDVPLDVRGATAVVDGFKKPAYAFIHTDNIAARFAQPSGEQVQFGVIVGNPPYQLDEGGFGASAGPIYSGF
jgi:hypothetical protein